MKSLKDLKIDLERLYELKYRRSKLSERESGEADMLDNITQKIEQMLLQNRAENECKIDPTQPFPQMKLF